MTASQAWLTNPAIVARQKLEGNEESSTCCKTADAAIAVPKYLGGREAVLRRADCDGDPYHLH
jgi:hypothetical protein